MKDVNEQTERTVINWNDRNADRRLDTAAKQWLMYPLLLSIGQQVSRDGLIREKGHQR
jgi:hypothetical protein